MLLADNDEAPLPEEVDEARSMMACPYYVCEGTCESGCYSEPRCITDAPLDGWEGVLRRAGVER